MKFSRTTIVLFSLIGFAIILTGCTKDSMEPEPSGVKDLWEITSASELNISSVDNPYQIHFGPNNQLFTVQPSIGSSFMYCNCENETGEWIRFTVDSTIFLPDNDPITRVVNDGSLWVLSATRLAKVTSCGVFESYEVVDKDTLSITDNKDRFVGLEIVNGTPWLLHAKWGLFRFDLFSESLVHSPVLHPYPFYTDLSEIGHYQSMAKLPDGRVVFNNEDGRAWIASEMTEVSPVEMSTCWDCLYNELQTSSTGVPTAILNREFPIRKNLPELNTLPALPISESPELFTSYVFDAEGYLAYYSGFPYNQPYIGLQPNGAEELIVNAQDAIEQGNIIVYDLAFSHQNELFAATNHGVLKYVGRDE